MYYYGTEINLLGINMNQLFWLSMVTFMLIMDDHYDLLVFVDDLDGGMGWLLFVVDWIISPFPTFSTNKTMRPGRWQELFVADLEKMDGFFPHMSILLVIDKIMNFQSPTYPKLQLVPPTAQSNTDFGDFKCTSLGLDSWTVHQPISQSNHLGVHRIPSNLMGMIFQPLRIVELYILSPSN